MRAGSSRLDPSHMPGESGVHDDGTSHILRFRPENDPNLLWIVPASSPRDCGAPSRDAGYHREHEKDQQNGGGVARSGVFRGRRGRLLGREAHCLSGQGVSGPTARYPRPSDLMGADASNGLPMRSNSEGSSFSGLFTRVEMGHIVIGSDG